MLAKDITGAFVGCGREIVLGQLREAEKGQQIF
jgi:hypothetical protein